MKHYLNHRTYPFSALFLSPTVASTNIGIIFTKSLTSTYKVGAAISDVKIGEELLFHSLDVSIQEVGDEITGERQRATSLLSSNMFAQESYFIMARR